MSDVTSFSLFKRSNGYYYILFERDGRRQWKSTGCSVKADALKALTNLRELLEESKPTAIPLAQFCKVYLEFVRATYSKATVDIARIALNHLTTIAGECSLLSLSPQHIDLYKSKRLKDKVSPVTVNVEIRALRTIMNVAVRWQYLEVNPFSKMQQLSVPERKPTFLAKEDFSKLLNSIKEDWLKELVVFAVLTGMRRGEILNLRWQNVDLSRKLIHIESDRTFKTKAGKRRVIPMNDAVSALLSHKASGRDNNDIVFTLNGRQIDGSYITHKFKKYSRKLNDAMHWHSLRHTFASWLVQDGVSLFEVQKLLGHSSSEVTQIYSHLLPEQLHNTVNRIVLNVT